MRDPEARDWAAEVLLRRFSRASTTLARAGKGPAAAPPATKTTHATACPRLQGEGGSRPSVSCELPQAGSLPVIMGKRPKFSLPPRLVYMSLLAILFGSALASSTSYPLDMLKYPPEDALDVLKWATNVNGVPPEKADKEELLLGALLAEYAYLDDEVALRQKLSVHDMELLAFRTSVSFRQHMAAMLFESKLRAPQWFVADKDGTKYVVVRGSDSASDWARNVLVKPETHRSSRWHAGFLAAAQTQLLQEDLTKFADDDADRLYLVGHSLGGAIALTLVGAELLPPRTPPVTVLTYGAPAPCHGECASALESARILSVVRGADIVPRLLGSNLAWLSWLVDDQAPNQLREGAATSLATLEGYRHPPSAKLFYASSPGNLVTVPLTDDRVEVLSLKEAAKASLLGFSWKGAFHDHVIANYVSALQFEPSCRNTKHVGARSSAAVRHVTFTTNGGQRRDGMHICPDGDCSGSGGSVVRWHAALGAFVEEPFGLFQSRTPKGVNNGSRSLDVVIHSQPMSNVDDQLACICAHVVDSPGASDAAFDAARKVASWALHQFGPAPMASAFDQVAWNGFHGAAHCSMGLSKSHAYEIGYVSKQGEQMVLTHGSALPRTEANAPPIPNQEQLPIIRSVQVPAQSSSVLTQQMSALQSSMDMLQLTGTANVVLGAANLAVGVYGAYQTNQMRKELMDFRDKVTREFDGVHRHLAQLEHQIVTGFDSLHSRVDQIQQDMRAGFEMVSSQVAGIAKLGYAETIFQLQFRYQRATGVQRSVDDVKDVEKLVEALQGKIQVFLQDKSVGLAESLNTPGAPVRMQYIQRHAFAARMLSDAAFLIRDTKTAKHWLLRARGSLARSLELVCAEIASFVNSPTTVARLALEGAKCERGAHCLRTYLALHQGLSANMGPTASQLSSSIGVDAAGRTSLIEQTAGVVVHQGPEESHYATLHALLTLPDQLDWSALGATESDCCWLRDCIFEGAFPEARERFSSAFAAVSQSGMNIDGCSKERHEELLLDIKRTGRMPMLLALLSANAARHPSVLDMFRFRQLSYVGPVGTLLQAAQAGVLGGVTVLSVAKADGIARLVEVLHELRSLTDLDVAESPRLSQADVEALTEACRGRSIALKLPPEQTAHRQTRALPPSMQNCSRSDVLLEVPGFWGKGSWRFDFKECTIMDMDGKSTYDPGKTSILDLPVLVLESHFWQAAAYMSHIGDEGAKALAAALETNTALTHLNLASNSIGDEGAKALAAALKTNTALTHLDLASNSIGNEGVSALAAALKTNTALTSLSLQGSLPPLIFKGTWQIMGPEGAKALAEAIETNTALTHLNLAWSDIVDEGAKALATVLETNTVLTHLNLASNSIGDEGAKALAAALETNTALTHLDLAWNRIDEYNREQEGATALAAALKTNTALTHLNLAWSSLGDEGAKALAAALKINTALTHLNLDSNSIDDEGAKALAAALETNTVLTHLDLARNRIGDYKGEQEGGTALAAALKTNTALTCLNLHFNYALRDKGVTALAAALETNTALKRLDLSATLFKNEGAKALAAAVKTNTALTHLDVHENLSLDRNEEREGAIALAAAVQTKTNTELIIHGLSRIDQHSISDRMFTETCFYGIGRRGWSHPGAWSRDSTV